MQRFFYLILIFVLYSVPAVYAQSGRVTPTPATTVPEALQGVPAIAPGYRSDERALPELGRVGVDLADQRPLTLREAIEMALVNNRDIEVTRKTHTIAEFELKSARAYFQPRLAGQTYYEKSTVANLSIFSSATSVTQSSVQGNLGVTGYIQRYGTVLSSTLNNQTIQANNPITLLGSQLTSTLAFNVTQPLIRGRRFDLPRRNIEIAKKNLDLTDTQFRQRSIETVASVERAYWDLTYALRNLQVQRDVVRDAQAQLEHNRRLVDEGQLAPIDIVASETQVANFEQSVYDALNIANQAENTLKNLIAPSRGDTIWEQSVTPVEPVELTVPAGALATSVETALDNRPELEINKTQRGLNELDQRFYRDQKKPQVDLIASYSSSGTGGNLNRNFVNPFSGSVCTVPTSPGCVALMAQQQAFLATIGGRGTAFTDILANKYPTFRFGLQFNLPLFGDKGAEAQLGKSLVEGERIEVQREQIEQNIQVEVRNALQSIRTNEARLRSAAIARENSVKQYESEQRKLDEGQSDVYRVLERQTAVAAARSNELRARTDLNKSIADYERATGTTLQANGVEAKLK